MIKNNELALISDQALDALLAPRPAPAPRAAVKRTVRRLRRSAAVEPAEHTPDGPPPR